jgi:hypothetical protein
MGDIVVLNVAKPLEDQLREDKNVRSQITDTGKQLDELTTERNRLATERDAIEAALAENEWKKEENTRRLEEANRIVEARFVELATLDVNLLKAKKDFVRRIKKVDQQILTALQKSREK